MTITPKNSDALTEDQVATYLSQNPDFFLQRDDLISGLELPHKPGQAVSLIERQVSVLRDRNQQSRQQISQLLESARKNTEIFEKCRKLVLALIEAQDTNPFFTELESSLITDFKCSAYSLLLFGNTTHELNHFTSCLSLESAKSQIQKILESKGPVLGPLRQEHQNFLFKDASDKVKSAAVLAINSNHKKFGLLSIGSDNPTYFEPGMGTLFLGFIADSLGRLLPKFVDLEGGDSLD